MLTRKPTLIELKAEDREELEQAKRLAVQQAVQLAVQQQAQFAGEQGEFLARVVEVKLRLPSKQDYDKLEQLLSGCHRATYELENYFFDGTERELNQRRVVLRLRFYNGDKKAVVTLKGKQILQDGIGTASEVEEAVPAGPARAYLDDPSALLARGPELVQKLRKQYDLKGLQCLGGFRNLRQEFAWEGYTLELDQTSYDWGTLYELECETDHPEQLRDRLEALLGSNGVQYSYSAVSKFANFINKTLE